MPETPEVGQPYRNRYGDVIKVPENGSKLAMNPDGSFVLFFGHNDFDRADTMIFRQGEISIGVFDWKGLPVVLFRVAPINFETGEDLGGTLDDIQVAVGVNVLGFPVGYVSALLDNRRDEHVQRLVQVDTSPSGEGQHRILGMREAKMSLALLQENIHKQMEKYDSPEEVTDAMGHLFEEFSKEEMMEQGNLWTTEKDRIAPPRMKLHRAAGEPVYQ